MFTLQGANYQRGGGKGHKPKLIPLTDAKSRGNTPATTKPAGADIARRLANLGMLPPGSAHTAPADPSADEMAAQVDEMWLARHNRLITE